MHVDADTFELGLVRLERSADPETGAPYLAFDLYLDGGRLAERLLPGELGTVLVPEALAAYCGWPVDSTEAGALHRVLTSPEWAAWLDHQTWLGSSTEVPDWNVGLLAARDHVRGQLRRWPGVAPDVLAELFSSRYGVGLGLAAAFVSDAQRASKDSD